MLEKCNGDVRTAALALGRAHQMAPHVADSGGSDTQGPSSWKPSGTVQMMVRPKASSNPGVPSSSSSALGTDKSATLPPYGAMISLPASRDANGSHPSREDSRERGLEERRTYAGMSYEEAKQAVFSRAEAAAAQKALNTHHPATVPRNASTHRPVAASPASSLHAPNVLLRQGVTGPCTRDPMNGQSDVTAAETSCGSSGALPSKPIHECQGALHRSGTDNSASADTMRLADKIDLIRTELVIDAGLPMPAAIAEANEQMGLENLGSLAEQVDQLLSVMGLPPRLARDL